MNVKDVWFDSYDEEGTLRSLAWTESLVTKQPQRLIEVADYISADQHYECWKHTRHTM